MKTMMLGIPKVALLSALVGVLLFGSWSTSEAVLQAVSPANDPVNGFPLFYTDTNLLQLEVCTDPANCVVTPVVALNDFSANIGFGAEMFYFIADAAVPIGPQVAGGATGQLRYRAALEAAFDSFVGIDPVATDGDPAPGTQIVFARINMQAIPAGILAGSTTYTVDHPYGTFQFTTAADGSAARFRLEDGGLVKLDFTTVLLTATTNFGPFLTAVTPAPPAGFIGNALITQTVTGSPLNRNFVTVTGANAGGPGNNSSSIADFNLGGQAAAFNLNVTLTGNGTGTVTSAPPGISCGLTCNAPFPPVTSVTLTAAPSATSVFSGWTGCTPVGGNPNQCTGTMNANTNVTAAFNEAVNVTVAPAAINLGAINLGSTVLRTITVANTGVTTGLNVGQITLTPGDFVITNDLCSNLTRAPGTSCIVDLMFTRAAIGDSAATLAILSDDPQTPTVNVSLSATGSLVPAFADVAEGAFAENFINTLFYNGITAGCGGGNFCPDSPITRKEMAVFLETSLGAVAPACGGNIFIDVTEPLLGAGFCGFIEKLASDGITGGCGGSNFCPNAPVTRGQMATFIEAALRNPANAICAGRFTDVPTTHIFCGFIERLNDDGITGGCGPSTFCPDDPVTRAQMAVFLVAAPPPIIP